MNDGKDRAGARGDSARKAVLLAVGFGCLVGYVRMASLGFVGYLSQGVVESSDAWYALRAAAGLATFALLALSGLFKWFKVGTTALLAATAAAVAAAIVFAVDSDGSLGAVVAVLGGCASAVLMYVWMLVLSCHDVRTIVVATLGGLVLAGAVIMGVPRLDAALALVVAVAAAFAAGSCALLLDSGLASCAPDGPPSKSEAARVPWLTVVMQLACGFLATVLHGVAQRLTWLYAWAPNYVVFGVAAVAVVAVTAGLIVGHARWMHVVWVPLFALLALALVFSCISLRESIQVAIGLLLASVFCAHFLHWMVFPALFATVRVPRAFLTGVVLFVANGSLATMTGDALGAALPNSMQNLGGVAGLAVIALAACAVATFLAYRRAFGVVGLFGGSAGEIAVGDGRAFGEAAGAGGAPAREAVEGGEAGAPARAVADAGEGEGEDGEERNPADLLRERMQRYVAEFGLTPRETEVALLTVQGFSCAYIAEKLVISNSTVRFHQQNLYRKFDVHSRNELIERVVASR